MSINEMFDSEDMVIAYIKENDVDLDERVVSSTTTNFKFADTLALLGYLEAFKVICSLEKYNNYDLSMCLRHAARKGKIDLVKYLVELPNRKTDICLAIRSARWKGHNDVVEYLESLGVVAEEEVVSSARAIQFFDETDSELSPAKMKEWSRGNDYEYRSLDVLEPRWISKQIKQILSKPQRAQPHPSLIYVAEGAKQAASPDTELPRYSGPMLHPEISCKKFGKAQKQFEAFEAFAAMEHLMMKHDPSSPFYKPDSELTQQEINKRHHDRVARCYEASSFDLKPKLPMEHPHGYDGKFDESTIPPRMLKMALAVHNFRSYGITVIKSPFHTNKVMFVNFPQNPCCTRCENVLTVNTQGGYINHVYLGCCDKCNLRWNVVHVKGDDIVERYVNRGQY